MALIVAATLLTVAVVVYVISPIIQDRHAPMDSDDGASDAHAKKRTALMALRDVEYDLATGKLDQADYEVLKAELSAEALAAVKAEEHILGGPSRTPAGTGAAGSTADSVVASEDAAARVVQSPPASDGPGVLEPSAGGASAEMAIAPALDDLEAKIARLRAGLRDGTTCTACAQVNRVGSRFCTNCGRPLELEASAPEAR